MLLLIEALLTAALAALCFVAPNILASLFARAEGVFRKVGRRKTLSVLVVVLSALAARATLLPIAPIPVPQVDDEYSHLLLADTLLHGRLANPTHPMWMHFETFDVNMRPTYASVYPPLQGLFLAAGKLLTGQYFAGVMVSIALMCGAICWMLQGWMPAEWAFLGGILAVMRFGLYGYWANTYMGGAASAIGGALALGALPRIKLNFRVRDSVILGVGLAILANSRPYEGVLLGLPIGASLLCWLLKQQSTSIRRTISSAVAPIGVVLAISGLGMAYYFWRVTGNPFRTPYQVNWETYGMMPKFLWQSLRAQQEAALRHPSLSDYYYVFERSNYTSTRTLIGVLEEWAGRVAINWVFYLGPLLSLPLLAAAATLPYGFRLRDLDSRTRFLLLTTMFVSAGIAAELFSFPHYAAPVTCVIIGLALIAMRRLRTQAMDTKGFGLALTRLLPVATAFVLTVRILAGPLHIPLAPSFLPSIYDTARTDTPSYSVETALRGMPGQNLLIVRYGTGSGDWMGWVHNDADIDRSKIVRAWDMGAERNRELIDYFKGRNVWQVTAGKGPLITPYKEEADQSK